MQLIKTKKNVHIYQIPFPVVLLHVKFVWNYTHLTDE